MSGELKFSVVIPLYNKREYIKRSLVSVLNQAYRVDEVIVVDDGSHDNWEDVVAEQLEHKNVRVVYQKNSGVSVARNRGAQEARNDLICFLDADDEWMPDFIIEMERLINDCRLASVYSLRHVRVLESGETVRQNVALPEGFSGDVENFLSVYRKGYGVIHSSAVCIRKEIIEKHGGFPPGARKSQDIFLWLMLGLNEKIGFRDVECVRRYEDGSGHKLRSDALSYHIEYYLLKGNIYNFRENKDLILFLKRSVIVMALAEKMSGNYRNVFLLRRASKEFGFLFSSCVWIATFVPSAMLALARKVQMYLR